MPHFYAVGSQLINLDQVRRIEVQRGGRALFYLGDDRGAAAIANNLGYGSISSIEQGVEYLEHEIASIIPAAPGWRVLTYIEPTEGHEGYLLRQEVIAWKLTPGWPEPVVADGEPSIANIWGVMEPSGVVRDSARDNQYFNSADEFLAAAQNMTARRAAE